MSERKQESYSKMRLVEFEDFWRFVAGKKVVTIGNQEVTIGNDWKISEFSRLKSTPLKSPQCGAFRIEGIGRLMWAIIEATGLLISPGT